MEDTVKQSDRSCLARMWREIQGSNNWEGLLDPIINPILKQEIIKYGEFAELCYDFFDCHSYSKYYGTCKYNPKKLFQQAEIHSHGYEISKYIYASTRVKLPRLFLRSLAPDTWSHETTWMGFIAVVKDHIEVERMGRRDIVVTWRGTETTLDWIEDLQGWLVPLRFKEAEDQENRRNYENKPVMVESGFLSVYTATSQDSRYSHMSARDLVLAELERLLELHTGEELSITLCGHSLGAALALLCAYDLGHMVSDRSPPVPVTAFTFGCPRVGNKYFADKLQELNVRVLRVVNVNDVVPRVPGVVMNESSLGNFLRACVLLVWMQPWTYSHVGVQMTVDNNLSPFLKPTRNPATLHNLEVYLHLVDGYSGEGGRDPALVNKFCDMLIDELLIPPYWWQEPYRGLVKNEKGRWTQRPRENEDAVFHH